jgi:uncharacterized protein
MISVAEIIEKERLTGNFFSPDAYLQGDFETGLIESRGGARLIALPEVLLQGLFAGLEEEVGQASSIVLFKCGYRWGKNFYRRFGEEISEYYGKNLAQMEMAEFLECLKQCWKTYGWGLLDLEFKYYQQGFLIAKTKNSPFIEVAPPGKKPVGFADAGILSGFFSQLTGTELHCIQTACESLKAPCNYFVLGLASRINPIDAWLEEGQDHVAIMSRLCPAQTQARPKTGK